MTTVAMLCMFMGLFLISITLFSMPAKASNTTISNVTTDGDVKDLYVMGFFPFSGQEWRGGESLLAATKIGIEDVNNQSVISGYRLKLQIYDTQCDPGLGMKGLFELLYSPPTKILILGDGCSSVTEAIARTSYYYNLVQVSYAALSPVLSNKKVFPFFARVAAPDTAGNPARVRFLQYFGWSQIATLYQTLDLFSKTFEDLAQRLHDAGLTVIRSESFSDDPSIQVRNLKKNDCRIIVGLFYQNTAQKVLCEAYKVGLYGRRIVWIFNGFYEDNWWKKGDENTIGCTFEELAEVAEGHFDFGVININPRPAPGISGWLPEEFKQKYNEAVNYTKLFADQLTPQTYDAVWAVALALNKTRQQLQDMGSNKSLENFSYNDSEMASLLHSNLLNLSFMGMRGPIAFDSNGDLVGTIKINRVQEGVKKTVAYFNLYGLSQLRWANDSKIVWKDGIIPGDSTRTRTDYIVLSIPLYASMCFLASLGILLACLFLLFNILLRNVKLVKMSSPRFNNVILVGCILAYSTVFIRDAGARATGLGCEFHTALLAMGSTLAFGALFAKTWRVHVIFTNTTKPQKKIPSDAQLFGMLGVLVLINLSLLVTWRVIDPRSLQVTSVSTTMATDELGEVEVWHAQLSCTSNYQLYFLGTFYGIHILVLLLGSILAYETRNVHYPELNDSKHIGLCIYNMALLSIPALVLGMALTPGLDLRYAIMATLVLLGTTVTQCLIFLPKVMAYRHSRIHGITEETLHSRHERTIQADIPSCVPRHFSARAEATNTLQLFKHNLP